MLARPKKSSSLPTKKKKKAPTVSQVFKRLFASPGGRSLLAPPARTSSRSPRADSKPARQKRPKTAVRRLSTAEANDEGGVETPPESDADRATDQHEPSEDGSTVVRKESEDSGSNRRQERSAFSPEEEKQRSSTGTDRDDRSEDDRSDQDSAWASAAEGLDEAAPKTPAGKQGKGKGRSTQAPETLSEEKGKGANRKRKRSSRADTSPSLSSEESGTDPSSDERSPRSARASTAKGLTPRQRERADARYADAYAKRFIREVDQTLTVRMKDAEVWAWYEGAITVAEQAESRLGAPRTAEQVRLVVRALSQRFKIGPVRAVALAQLATAPRTVKEVLRGIAARLAPPKKALPGLIARLSTITQAPEEDVQKYTLRFQHLCADIQTRAGEMWTEEQCQDWYYSCSRLYMKGLATDELRADAALFAPTRWEGTTPEAYARHLDRLGERLGSGERVLPRIAPGMGEQPIPLARYVQPYCTSVLVVRIASVLRDPRGRMVEGLITLLPPCYVVCVGLRVCARVLLCSMLYCLVKRWSLTCVMRMQRPGVVWPCQPPAPRPSRRAAARPGGPCPWPSCPVSRGGLACRVVLVSYSCVVDCLCRPTGCAIVHIQLDYLLHNVIRLSEAQPRGNALRLRPADGTAATDSCDRRRDYSADRLSGVSHASRRLIYRQLRIRRGALPLKVRIRTGGSRSRSELGRRG